MRTKLILVAAIFVLTCPTAIAQTFTDNTSDYYTAKITLGKCQDDYCSATIRLYKKNSKALFQEFKTNEIRKPDEEDMMLEYADFNFDGIEDLAVQNGSGGYGMGAYDVYLYNATRKQFVKSKELTNLASHQGMFAVDREKKLIKTFSKSGCCWHQEVHYKVAANKGLVKVYDKVEDGTKSEGMVTVTIKKLSNNKWTSSVKKYKAKDYYKD